MLGVGLIAGDDEPKPLLNVRGALLEHLAADAGHGDLSVRPAHPRQRRPHAPEGLGIHEGGHSVRASSSVSNSSSCRLGSVPFC